MISPASKGTSRRVVWAGMAALAGLAIIAGGAIWYQRSRPSPPVLQTESLLFSAPGFLSQPNLSPDGNQVAFTCDAGTNGYTQIYLKVVGSGEAALQGPSAEVQLSCEILYPRTLTGEQLLQNAFGLFAKILLRELLRELRLKLRRDSREQVSVVSDKVEIHI
jgi:hypothetical protein